MRGRGVIGAGGALALVATALVAAAEQTPTVSIQVFQFQPAVIQVRTGMAITWTNRDDIEHTVTSGDPDHRTGRFDLRLPGRDAANTVSFTEPGVYRYFCDRHPSMRGEIRVNA